MKNLFLLSTLLFFTLAGCSEDENTNNITTEIDSPLIGNWTFEAEFFDGEMSDFKCSEEDVQEFKKDGTYLANLHGGSSSVINGETVYDCTDGETFATFELDENKINFVFSPGTDEEEKEVKTFTIDEEGKLTISDTGNVNRKVIWVRAN